jgi:UDP-glucose 4-epimerase
MGQGRSPCEKIWFPGQRTHGIAKYAVELTEKHGSLNYIIFRPHNVYGEYQNIGDKYRNVVGIFMNQILQGKPMTIFGDGEQKGLSVISEILLLISHVPHL